MSIINKKAILIPILSMMAVVGKAQSHPAMVTIVGDTFKMGNEQMQDPMDEKTIHKVVVSTFKMAKTEITVAQWKVYCESTASPMPTDTPPWGWKDEDPMVNISWYDAMSYCEWLSHETGKKYRLPTEAEWEFAARGGGAGRGYQYSGGKGAEMVGWTNNNAGSSPHTVASKRPNELGLYDMTGNVFEWCQDFYGSYNMKQLTNPKGPTAGKMSVYRGGSWFTPTEYMSTGVREHNDPKLGYNFVGFRPIEEVDEFASQTTLAATR